LPIIARNPPIFEASTDAQVEVAPSVEANSKKIWQQELADMIRTAEDLVAFVGLPESFILEAFAGQQQFPIKVTRHYASQIERGNPQDPLLLQVLPQFAEGSAVAGYLKDPLAEKAFQANKGILHKYHGRALLITTESCAIHCRYCFRRHFPYQEHRQSLSDWDQALAHIEQDPSIHEIILSGGDPLMLTDQHLDRLIARINSITHVHTLRIHSRIPIVLPSRITDSLLSLLRHERLKTVMVIHSNHANEVNAATGSALKKLGAASHALLNQTVLLRGINDCVDNLVALSHTLFKYSALPYYLHLLDKVEGAAHFDLQEDQIKRLMSGVRSQLPGYLVPKLVREVPGEASKSPVFY